MISSKEVYARMCSFHYSCHCWARSPMSPQSDCPLLPSAGQPWRSRASHDNRSCSHLSNGARFPPSCDGLPGKTADLLHLQLLVTPDGANICEDDNFVFSSLTRQFYEGYGQTECTAGCSLTLAGDWTAGNDL